MSLSQDFDLIRCLAEGGVGWQVVDLECDYRGYNKDVWSLMRAVINCDAEPTNEDHAEVMRMTACRQYKSAFWQGLATWKQSQYEPDEMSKRHFWEKLQVHMRTADFRDQADNNYLLRQIESTALDRGTVGPAAWYATARLVLQMVEAGDFDAPRRVLQVLKLPYEHFHKWDALDLIRKTFELGEKTGQTHFSRKQMAELRSYWETDMSLKV